MRRFQMFNYEGRRSKLMEKLKDNQSDLAVITDPRHIYYLTGYHGALGIEWGRPDLFILTAQGESCLIVPVMEEEMAHRQTNVTVILPWTDGIDEEWQPHLKSYLKKHRKSQISVDVMAIPKIVQEVVESVIPPHQIKDIGTEIYKMRMIKDEKEIQVARHAGEVAVAMLKGAMSVAAPGVYEYEVSLSAKEAGTRHAAKLMAKYYKEEEPFNYPGLDNVQIMASGHETTMCHHRNGMTKLKKGEPLFICHCGTAQFKNFFVGFDRILFVGEKNEKVSELLNDAEAAQQAALSQIRPGAVAEQVFNAYAEIIESKGYPIPFRAGRSLGFSYNENPQLARGSQTILEAGMIFAVDGAADTKSYRTQVGDSILVTEEGFEFLTPYTKDHEKLIVGQ